MSDAVSAMSGRTSRGGRAIEQGVAVFCAFRQGATWPDRLNTARASRAATRVEQKARPDRSDSGKSKSGQTSAGKMAVSCLFPGRGPTGPTGPTTFCIVGRE